MQCNAVTEAERKYFMGKCTPYTSYPAKIFSPPLLGTRGGR